MPRKVEPRPRSTGTRVGGSIKLATTPGGGLAAGSVASTDLGMLSTILGSMPDMIDDDNGDRDCDDGDVLIEGHNGEQGERRGEERRALGADEIETMAFI